MNAVEITLNDAPMEVTIPMINDESSAEFGSKDGFSLCGARNYDIVTQKSNYENFLRFDGARKLTFEATRDTDVGSHFVTI